MTVSEPAKSTSAGQGRVLLITGASSGIGAAVARQAAAAGWRVALLARRLEKVQALAAELGGAALAIEADVTEWSDLERAVARTRDAFGQLDAVLANAGLSRGAPNYASGDPTPDEWREMILTNVLGAALTARASLPDLIASRGHLLLVGSVAGRVATPGPYSATKWAVSGMGESIRKEVSAQGVRVTLIEPGRVETPFWTRGVPDGPILHEDDVARAVLYALSQPPHVAVNEILIRPTGQDV